MPHKHSTLNIILFIVVLFLNLMIKTDHTKWSALSDPYDYLQQSRYSFSDPHLWFPEKAEGFNPRPFAVPLLYKVAASDPDRIIILQKFLHSLSILLLVFSMLLFVRKNYLRYVGVFFTYLLMSWWNILGWTTTLLSESLSISLMFLWIATFLFLLKKRTALYLILHIIITVLFSFTRDNWPYLLLTFYFLLTLSAWVTDKKFVRYSVIMLVFCSAIFFVQGRAANIAKRYRIPVLNNIVYKIRPHDEYMQWFAKQGMPCGDKLITEFGRDSVSKEQLFMLYKDTTYAPLYNWIDAHGKNTWARFLITHPSHSLLFKESRADLSRILAYNIGYTGGMRGYTWISYYLFPLFNPVILLLLMTVQLLLFRRKRELMLLLPVALSLVFLLNVFLMYNADAMEMTRHLFVTNIIIQFIGILSVVIILDSQFFNDWVTARWNKWFSKTKK